MGNDEKRKQLLPLNSQRIEAVIIHIVINRQTRENNLSIKANKVKASNSHLVCQYGRELFCKLENPSARVSLWLSNSQEKNSDFFKKSINKPCLQITFSWLPGSIVSDLLLTLVLRFHFF